jgi:hypothetical protein
VGCPASSFEGIGDGCAVHGMDEETIDALIKKLNERIAQIEAEKEKGGKKKGAGAKKK